MAKVDVLLVENVSEFADWGPLDENGQPIKTRKGEFFNRFLGRLKSLGYRYEWRILCAADYGDPTTRRRFFMQAVLDEVAITWPKQTHYDPKKTMDLFDQTMKPWRTAAECIDWSIPCPSIFDRKKPLAEATLRRIAAGINRYVLNGKPFIVNMRGTSDNQVSGSPSGLNEPIRTISSGGIHAALVSPSLIQYHATKEGGQERVQDMESPIATLDTSNRYGIVAASLIQTSYGERPGQAPRILDLEKPLGTVVAGGQKHALVAAFLAKHFSGVVGSSLEQPLGTVTAVDHHSLVAATITKFQQNSIGQGLDEPMHTVMAGAPRFGLVAAFLTQYYGQNQASGIGQPVPTVTTLDRHGLVTVTIDGETYAIVDIGLRMLEPHELAKAMGFPDWYRFVREDGTPLTKKDQVKMIGNACPVNTVSALIQAVLISRSVLYRVAA